MRPALKHTPHTHRACRVRRAGIFFICSNELQLMRAHARERITAQMPLCRRARARYLCGLLRYMSKRATHSARSSRPKCGLITSFALTRRTLNARILGVLWRGFMEQIININNAFVRVTPRNVAIEWVMMARCSMHC